MPVTVIDIIKPKNNGAFPITEDTEHKGGWRVAATLLDRDAIPAGRRKEGMRVRVPGLLKSYELVGGIDNTDWTEVNEGAVAPFVGMEKTLSDITMEVDFATGASPPGGTVIHNQAEYNALGAPFKYLYDAFICLPKFINHVVRIQLLDGDQCAKPDIYPSYPGWSSAVALSTFYTGIDAGDAWTDPNYIYYPGIYVEPKTWTEPDEDRTGTLDGFKGLTKTSGADWTPNEWEGKWVLLTSGMAAGTTRLIKGNTATVLNMTNVVYGAGACTFKIVDTAAVLLPSTDGLTEDSAIWDDYPTVGNCPITFTGVRFGSAGMPCTYGGMALFQANYMFDSCAFIFSSYGFYLSQVYTGGAPMLRLKSNWVECMATCAQCIQAWYGMSQIQSNGNIYRLAQTTGTHGVNFYAPNSYMLSADDTWEARPGFNGTVFYNHTQTLIEFAGQVVVVGNGGCVAIGCEALEQAVYMWRLYVSDCTIGFWGIDGGRYKLIPLGPSGVGCDICYEAENGTEILLAGDPSVLPVKGAGHAFKIDGEFFEYVDLPSGSTIIGRYGSKISRI